MRGLTSYLKKVLFYFSPLLVLTPSVVSAQSTSSDYIDLVGSDLSGWNLSWGACDGASSNANDPTYMFSLSDANSHMQSAHGISVGNFYSDVFGTATTSDQQYMPQCDKDYFGKSEGTSTNYRFYIHSSSDYDAIFTNTQSGNPNCYQTMALKCVPDGYSTSIRLGSADRPDGSANTKSAEFNGSRYRTSYMSCAEQASYTTTIGSKYTLLELNYCAVMKDPESSGHDILSHKPAYSIVVYVQNASGNWVRESCLKNQGTSDATTNTFCRIPYNSNGGTIKFATTGWQKVTMDLSKYVGKQIKIEFRTHDCLFSETNAGSHYAYMYVAARLKSMAIDINYCSDNDPIDVTAPSGFKKYTWDWKYADGSSVSNNPTSTTSNTIHYEAGVIPSTYKTLSIGFTTDETQAACIQTIDTTIAPSKMRPAIEAKPTCQYSVTLKDLTSYDLDGDTLGTRTWYIFEHNDSYGSGENPGQTVEKAKANGLVQKNMISQSLDDPNYIDEIIDPKGQWVYLRVVNKNGCDTIIHKYITPNPIAKWKTDEVSVCSGSKVNLTFLPDDSYTEYANNLLFDVEGVDGMQHVRVPFSVSDSAELDKTEFPYTVTDYYGCTYNGTYKIVVNPSPAVYLDDATTALPDYEKDGNKITIYTCPGTTRSIGAYSYVANQYHSDMSADENYTNIEKVNDKYTFPTFNFAVGAHYFEGKDATSKTGCVGKIWFNIAYRSDSVDLDVPQNVCPFDTVTLKTINTKEGVTSQWYKNSIVEANLIGSGEEITLMKPDKEATYYCVAYDQHECKYIKNFSFVVSDIIEPTLTFIKNSVTSVASTGHVDAEGGVHTSRYHVLPKICGSDSFAVSANISNTTVGKVQYYYMTSGDTKWTSAALNGKKFTKNGFKLEEGGTLKVYIKTVPYDKAGNELCTSYDTVEVSAYPAINAISYFGDPATLTDAVQPYGCDGTKLNLSVYPYWEGQSATNSDGTNHRDDFTITWTDYGHQTNPWTSFDGEVNMNYDDALSDKDGHYNLYSYVISSKAAMGGCTISDTIKAYIIPSPSFSLNADPAFICPDSSFSVIATDLNENKTLSTYNNNKVVRWEFLDPYTHAAGDANPKILTSNNFVKYSKQSTGGVFTVTAYNSYGCSAKKDITVESSTAADLLVEVIPYYNNDANTKVVTSVCSNELYKLRISDKHFSDNGACDDSVWVTVIKLGGPYDKLTWSKNSANTTAYPYQYNVKNDTLVSALNANNYQKALFSWYRSQTNTGSTDKYDKYEIHYRNQCGCETVTEFKVLVKPSPDPYIVSSTGKDFLCPKESLTLKGGVNNGNSSDTYTYTWVKGWRNAGDGINSESLRIKASGTDDDAKQIPVNYLTADNQQFTLNVTNGVCNAATHYTVYNHTKPSFNLEANPSTICEDNKSVAVTLTATSDEPRPFYYNPGSTDYTKKTCTFSNTSWGDKVTSTTLDHISAYLNADDSLCVMAGAAHIVGRDTARNTTSNYYFCYDTTCIKINVSKKPILDYQVLDADGNVVTSICAGSDYQLKIRNNEADHITNDNISIVSTNGDVTDNQEVSARRYALFGPYTSKITDSHLRFNVTINYSTVDGTSSCQAVDAIDIPVNQVPIVQLGDKNGTGKEDTARFCLNEAGIDLIATITNESSNGKYSYTWRRNGVKQLDITGNETLGTITKSSSATKMDALYTVQVTETTGGCVSNLATCTVLAVDTPTVWRGLNWGCEGGYSTYYVYENTGVQMNRYKIDFTAANTYHAYFWNPNPTQTVKASDGVTDSTVYHGRGEEITGFEDVADWYHNSCNYAGSKTVDGVKYDTCRYSTMRSYVNLGPLRSAGNRDFFLITKTSKTTGCTGSDIIGIDPIQYPDPDKVVFGIRFTDEEGNSEDTCRKMEGVEEYDAKKHYVKFSSLKGDGSDTIAHVCPGYKLLLDVMDMTDYKYYSGNTYYIIDADGNGKNLSTAATSDNRSQFYLTNMVTNGGVGWNTPTSGTGQGRTTIYTFNPNWSVNGPVKYKFHTKQVSAGCATTAQFSIGITNSPALSYLRDNICVYNNKTGKATDMIKFRAVSKAKDTDPAKHTYTWWTSDDKTKVEEYYTDLVGNGSLTVGADTFWIRPTDATQSVLGTSCYRDYKYRLHDKADGYCPSSPIDVSGRVMQNPQFDINITPEVLCAGDKYSVTVNQNRSYSYGTWQDFYYGKSTDATRRASLYNDNYTGRAHSFTDNFDVTKQNDTVWVTCKNTSYNSTMSYDNSSNLVTNYLYCTTTKFSTVNAFESPKPKLSLVKYTAGGLYASADTVQTVYLDRDSTGSRKICPDDDYKYVFFNINPDTMKNYKSSVTTYTLIDTTSHDTARFSRTSSVPVSDSKIRLADDHVYMLTASTSNGCVADTNWFRIPLASIPEVKIDNGVGAVCAKDENGISLSAIAQNDAPFTYQWYNNATVAETNKIAGETDYQFSAKPATGTDYESKTVQYTVEIANKYACKANATTDVTVYPLPQFTAEPVPAASVCNGDEVKLALTKSAGEVNYTDDVFTYSWDMDNNKTSIGAAATGTVTSTSSKITTSTDLQVKASVTPVSGLTCASSQKITVDTYDIPIPTVSLYKQGSDVAVDYTKEKLCPNTVYYPSFQQKDAKSACVADTFYLINMTTNVVDTFTTLSGAMANHGSKPKTFVLTENTKYQYYMRTSCGCTSSKYFFTVQMATAPTVTVDGDKTFCQGTTDKISFKANSSESNLTWKWDSPISDADLVDPAVGDEVSFLPTTSHIYHVTGSNASGCSGEASFEVTMLATPAISLTAPTAVCYGSSAALDVKDLSSADAEVSSISWTPNATGSHIDYQIFEDTKFTAIATAKNGCKAQDTVTVHSVALPTPKLSFYRVDDPTVEIIEKVCNGTAYYPVFKNPKAMPQYCSADTFYLINGNTNEITKISAFAGVDANSNHSVSFILDGVTPYSYYAVNSCGCKSSSETASISVASSPMISVTADATTFCDNDPKEINVTANAVGTDDKVMTWKWNTSTSITTSDLTVKDIKVKPTITSTYTVTGTNGYGCSSVADIDITALETPTFDIEAPTSVCSGSNAELSIVNPSTELVSYIWSNDSQKSSTTVTVDSKSTFWAQAIAKNSCKSDKISVTVDTDPLPVPTVTLHRLDGTVIDNGTKLCPGTKFYPVFNDNSLSTCATDTFFVNDDDHYSVAAPGTSANLGGELYFTVNGNTTYTYYTRSSCGCASAKSTFTVEVAEKPVVSIVAGNSTGKYCEGSSDPMTLTANSASAITKWSWLAPVDKDNDKATVSVVPSTLTYSVIGTNASGCADTAEYKFTQVAKPIAIITGTSQVCSGDKATLNAVVNSTSAGVKAFYWYDADTYSKDGTNDNLSVTSKLEATVATSKSYYLQVVSSDNCTSELSDKFTVTAITTPEIKFTYDGINGTGKVCEGDLLTVTPNTGNSSTTYKWYTNADHSTPLEVGDNIVAIADNGTSVTLKPIVTQPTLYVVATLNTCVGQNIATVSTASIPDLTVSGLQKYCAGQTLELNASSTSEEPKFYFDHSTNASSTYKIEKVQSTVTSVYVEVVDKNGCRNHEVKDIKVAESPVITVTPSEDKICANTMAHFTASGADSYKWYLDGNTSVLGTDPNYESTRLSEAATFKVVGTATNTGCSDSTYAKVSIKTTPVVSLKNALTDGKVNFCSGDSVALEVYGASSYSWGALDSKHITGPSNNIAYVSPSADDEYKVTGYLDGCPASLVINVHPLPTPTVLLTADASSICAGNKVNLTAKVNGSSDKQTGFTYRWQDAPAVDVATREMTLTANQDFSVTVTSTEGCAATSSQTITVNPNPSVYIATNLSTVCQDSAVMLTAKPSNGKPKYTYTWTDDSNNVLSTAAYFNYNLAAATNFNLSVIDANGCSSTQAKKTVFVQNRRTLTNLATTNYCVGDSARVSLVGATEFQYDNNGVWTTKADSAFLFPTGEHNIDVVGRVSLINTTGRYCPTDLLRITETVSNAPVVTMVANPASATICEGENIELTLTNGTTALSSDDYTFSWDGNSTNKTGAESTKLTSSRNFRATVTSKSGSGCTTSVEQYVTVNKRPVAIAAASQRVACADSVVTVSATASGSTHASPKYTFSWKKTSDADWSQVGEKLTPVISQNETYTVIATDNNSCSSEPSSVTVLAQANPVIKNNAKENYCDQELVQLYLTGANTYFVDDAQASGAETSYPDITTNHTFRVYGRDVLEGSADKFCQSKTEYINVTVNPSPSVAIDGVLGVCSGQSLNLTANVKSAVDKSDLSDYTFFWSNGQSTQDFTDQYASTRDVSVTVAQKSTHCSTKVTETATIYELPSVSITSDEGDMVCATETVNLTAVANPESANNTFHWSRSLSGETESHATYSTVVNNTETFSVYVTDIHNCQSPTSSLTVRTVARPVVGVSGPDAICQNENVTLTLQGAAAYVVNGDTLPANVYTGMLTESHPYIYTIYGVNTLTTGHQCVSDKVDYTVAVNPAPSLVITGNDNFCKGNTLKISASGAESYMWNVKDNRHSTDADGNLVWYTPVAPAVDTFELNPTGSADGTYSYMVKGKGSNGCITTQTVVVNTLPSPTFTLTSTAKGICTNEEITFGIQPNGIYTQDDADTWTYVWHGDDITGATGSSVTTLVTGGTKYGVTATNTSGCETTEEINIVKYGVPDIAIDYSLNSDAYKNQNEYSDGDVIKLCPNDKLRLFAQPATGSTGISEYEWDETTKGQFYFPNDDDSHLTYTHKIVATSANGCTATRDVNVEMQTLPQVTLQVDEQYCQNTDITLIAQGAERYEWPDFNYIAGATQIVPATTVGQRTYTVYGYSAENCRSAVSATINILEAPHFKVDDATGFICIDSTATLRVEPSDPDADYTYYWSSPEIPGSIEPLNEENEVQVRPTEIGMSSVYAIVTDNNTTCQDTAWFEITTNAKPSLSISGDASATEVCRGSELDLYALGANQYEWNTGSDTYGKFSTGEPFASTPSVSTTYTLIGYNNYAIPTHPTDTLVCSAKTKVKITVKQSPSVQINGKDLLCYGDSIYLLASGIDLTQPNTSYAWEGSSCTTAELKDVFKAASGQTLVYVVTGTASNGCTATASKSVTMRPKTKLTVTAPSPVCEGDLVTVTAEGDDIKYYRWDDNQITNEVSHALYATDTFRVTATDINGCKVTDSAVVVMQEKPVLVNETLNSEVCSGSQVALIVSGASTYVWDGDETKNKPSLIIAPTTNEIHTVVGKYGVCTVSMDVPVTIIPSPIVQIQGAGSVCMGSEAKVYPFCNDANAKFAWTTTATHRTDGDTMYISPKIDAKVTLYATNTAGCKSFDSTTITVNNLPDVKISGDLKPCADTYTDLEASGAMAYVWSADNDQLNSSTYSPSVGTTDLVVNLEGTDANGCKSSTSVTIQPTQRPDFTINGETETCAGSTVQLSVENNLTACSYVWDGKVNGTTYTTSFDEAGNHDIEVVAELKKKPGCTTTKTYSLKVKEIPELYITGNATPCENDTLNVLAHGADEYQWSSKSRGAGDTYAAYTRPITTPNPFSVSLSGWKDGCRADTAITFQVVPAPLVTIKSDLDETCADGIVELTASSNDAASFDWGADGAGATIYPVITESKTFTVKVVDKNKCTGTASYDIKLINSPKINLFASKNYEASKAIEMDANGNVGTVEICEGDPLTLSATGAKTWSWENGSDKNVTANYTLPATDLTQTVSVTGYLGNCVSTKVIKIKPLTVPDPWIDGSTSVCEGDTIKLTAMGADHYEWSGVTGVSGANSDTLNYKILYTPVEASVKAIAANGCFATMPLTLTFTQAPDFEVKSEATTCVNAPLEMSIVNPDADTYAYVWNDTYTDTTFTYRSVVTGADTVTVMAKRKEFGGCSTTKKVAITTHANPYVTFAVAGDYVTVNADSSIQNCSGSDLTLVPLGAKYYEWKTSELDTVTNRMVIRPHTNTVYTITGTDEYGCTSDREIEIKVTPAPVLYSQAYGTADENGQIKLSICYGDTVDLDVNGAKSYTWFDGSSNNSVRVHPTASRSYTVTGTSETNACPSQAEFVVTVNKLPIVAITDTLGHTSKASVCQNDKFILTPSGAKSYIWYNEDNEAISYRDSLVEYAEDTVIYTVVGTDSNMCKAYAKFRINAIPAPVIYTEPAAPSVCSGTGVTIYGRGSANTWMWKFNNDTLNKKAAVTVSPEQDATYTLVASNRYGCTTEKDVEVEVLPAPSFWVDGYAAENGINDTIDVCKYQNLTMTLTGDADSYMWTNGSTDPSMTVNRILLNQTFQAKATAANGCTATLRIPVAVRPSADLTIKGDRYVCYGNQTTLTAVGENDAYDEFYWNNNMIDNTVDVTIVSDTTFSVHATNTKTGCTNDASISISPKKLPVLGYQGDTSVCKGASSVIYATGANSYVWHDGSTGDAYVSKPTTDDIYKVIGTLDGCSDSLTINVTVIQSPTIYADGLKPICLGDSLKIVAKGADSYEWSTGVKTAEFSALPVEDITYTLSGTSDSTHCTTTIEVPVTVRPRPTVSIDGSNIVCQNAETDLTAVVKSSQTVDSGAGNEYSWFVGDSVVSNQYRLAYTITDNKTKIRLVAADPAGCTNEANITINALAAPKLSVTGPDSICVGNEASFYATGATSYQWIINKDTATGNIYKTTPEVDQAITCVGISALGCKTDSLINLTVNQLPTVFIEGDTNVCRGNAMEIAGKGALTYRWSDGSVKDTFNAVPVASGEYQVTGTDKYGCKNTYKFNIQIHDKPQFDYIANTAVCKGEPDSLIAFSTDGSACEYVWESTNDITLLGDTVAPVIPSACTFRVTATDTVTKCYSSQSFRVDVYDLPVLSYLGNDTICLGDTVVLLAQGADTKQYSWKNAGNVVSTEPMLRFIPTGSTMLSLEGAIANCKASLEIPVTVVIPPYVYIAASKDTICRGSSVTLNATGADSYKWATGDTDTTLTYTPARSTVYTLTGTNDYGCVSTVSKIITVIDIPNVRIATSKNYICPNQADSVTFMASSSSDSMKYSWSSIPYMYDVDRNGNKDTMTAEITDSTMIYLTGTDMAGCVGVDSFYITKRPEHDLVFTVNPRCVDKDSRKVRLTGSFPDDGVWIWDVHNDGDTLMGSVATYEFAKNDLPEDSTIVTVHAVDKYGCVYEGESYIYKWHDFWAPDAFTPNGDGLNDKFCFRGGEYVDDFSYIIYNRLGEIVFKGKSIDDAWDGTYKGKKCPQGVYGYTVNYNSSSYTVGKTGKRKGYVSLIR